MTALPVTGMHDEGLKKSLYVSGGLHLAVLLFLYFGLPHFMKPLPTPYVPVPFEIVDIADMTNTRIKDKEEPKQQPAPPPKPEPKSANAPPVPPEPQKAEAVEALLPKPSQKPKPPEKAQPKTDPLASVLKDVAKLKPAEQQKTDTKTDSKDQPAPPKSLAPALSDRLSISEEDALRRQIEQCWNPPIGARDAQSLVVEITIAVNQDKTVQSAEVVDKTRMASDPYFRAAGEAALRALYNPKCNPLLLPDGKYDQWKAIDFTFDPRDML